MGATIGGLLGTAGGAGGTGFAPATSAPITNPVTGQQISGAYTGTQNSLQAQQALLAALQQQNGLGNQSQVYGQLQGVANGTGPNPAQNMLNQATAQNVAQTAALQAGQRGAASNVGLMARQIGQQGAATQQQSAGQAATLQSQQQLNAINAASGIANTQAANQIGQTNAGIQAQQAEQGQLLGAQGQFNTNVVGGQNSINAANAGLAGTSLGGQQSAVGGIFNAAGAGGYLGSGAKTAASSGNLFASGGDVPARSTFADYVNSRVNQMAEGGEVPALVSPGEKYLSPQAVDAVRRGANPMSVGETIPGKPKVGGARNSYANDVVKKKLQVGGLVVPRSETQSEDPEKNSEDFVARVLAKRKSAGRGV